MLVPILRVRRRSGKWPLGVARNASRAERVVSIALLVPAAGLAGWSVAYAMLGPAPLGVWRVRAAFQWAGWCMVAAGFVVVVLAQTQMGIAWRLGIDAEPTALVTRGLFAIVRNPIYAGVMLILGGLLLVSPAWVLIAIIAPAVLLINVQVRREEHHLRRLHGRAFDAWAARTGRFVPGLGRARTATRSTSPE